MDIVPTDKTLSTAHYQEAFQNFVENEYCDKNRHLPVI